MRRHFVGIGIVTVVFAMIFTVVVEVAGKEAGFHPDGFELLSASEFSGMPDRTGYDLSGEGEEGEEVSSDSDADKDKEEEGEEENTEPDESEILQANEGETIILPDGMTDVNDASDAIDVAVNLGMDKNGNLPGITPQNPWEDSPEEEHRSSFGKHELSHEDKEGAGGAAGNPPGGIGSEPEPPKEDDDPGKVTEDEKFSIVIDGETKEFANEDEALAWFADHAGTNDGQYFEGFTRDENGNLTPSYTDRDQFDGNPNGDVAYDYTGSSGVFVVPAGSTGLDLFKSNHNVKTIVIPKAVDNIVIGDGCGFTVLEKFIVSEENENYISVDGILYKKLENGELKLEAVPAAKKEIEKWPDQLICIGENSFYQSNVKTVELPDTVAAIEDQAFNESSVETIILPESVKTIGTSAFSFASPEKGEEPSLHKIIVKAKEPPQVSNTSFYWMDYQLEHHLGDPCTQIMVPDFADDSVYAAYLNSWGMAIAKHYGGDAALQILNTSNGAQNRYEYYEKGGQKGFKRIGDQIVYQDDELGRYRSDENGDKVLVECTAVIKSGLVDLKDSGIVSIDEGAFDSNYTSMVSIRLPESLQAMPENLFENNQNLKVIISYASAPPAAAPGAPSDCAVFVKPDALAAYQTRWGDKVRKILGTSESYSVLASGLVFDSGSTRLLDVPADMTSLTVPSYVTAIYDEAAAGNSRLNELTIPAAVRNVGEGAFSNCTALTKAIWGSTAKVPASCFEGCANLTTFNASGSGHNLTEIGDRAFYGCTSLGTVLWYSYPSGGQNYYYYYYLQRIGEKAFYGCTSMTYAYLHMSVTSVGRSAFEGSGLTEVFWYAPAPVPDSCFAGCTSLGTVGWGSSLVSGIGSKAFYACTGLSALAIPSAVSAVSGDAFGGRNGSGLVLTFLADTPPAWDGREVLDALTIYVPDSEENGDEIYRAYLDAWSGWLGEHPEEKLKSADGAQNRVFSEEGIAQIMEDEDQILPEEEEVLLEGLETEEINAQEAEPGEAELEGTNPEGTDPEEADPGEADSDETEKKETDSKEEEKGEANPEEIMQGEPDSEKKDSKEDGEEKGQEQTDKGETDQGEPDAGKRDSQKADTEE